MGKGIRGSRGVALGALALSAWAAWVPCAPAYAAAPPMPLTVAPQAAQWPLVVAKDLEALMPPPPPAAGSPAEAAELRELREWQAKRSPQDQVAISYWNQGPATMHWGEIARAMLLDHQIAPPRAAHDLAYLNGAMYEAIVIAWKAKAKHKRALPAKADPSLQAVAGDAGIPSYPSEHMAAAAAASSILGALFPTEAAQLRRKAMLVGETRLAGGACYRSDVEAGRALGEAVAQRFLARMRTDGSDRKASLPLPREFPQWQWQVPAPMEPLAGTWKPWFLARPSQFRLPRPPVPGSAAFQADLADVIAVSKRLTPQQVELAKYWNFDVPAIMWNDIARPIIKKHHLNTVTAARVEAGLHFVLADAFIGTWDTKYTHLQPRPIMQAPAGFQTVVMTPPHPSYPSGHAAASKAAAEFLGAVFPGDAQEVHRQAADAAMSRLYGGIHYRRDNNDGLKLGSSIGRFGVGQLKAIGLLPAPIR